MVQPVGGFNAALSSPALRSTSQPAAASSLLGVSSAPVQAPPPEVNILMLMAAALAGLLQQQSAAKDVQGGSSSSSYPGTAAQAAPQAAAPSSSDAPGGGAAGGNGRLKIAQIDDFSTDNTGFNHGQEVAKTIQSGGGDASLAGKVDLMQFNVAGGNTNGKTANALQNVLQRVNNGEQVDAVNISLQAFQQDGNTAQVQQLIDQLAAKGVPVAVAAGNNGKSAHNELTTNNSFNVQSATNGQVNANSGLGNVTANGRTTSFATANLTPILAAMKNRGLSLGQIKQNL